MSSKISYYEVAFLTWLAVAMMKLRKGAFLRLNIAMNDYLYFNQTLFFF
ncbi:MAG: hypothetical protein ACTSRU_16910 [Candidatus Hodarchaeales archaeon]